MLRTPVSFQASRVTLTTQCGFLPICNVCCEVCGSGVVELGHDLMLCDGDHQETIAYR